MNSDAGISIQEAVSDRRASIHARVLTVRKDVLQRERPFSLKKGKKRTMDIHTFPGKTLPPNILRFLEVFSALEKLVSQGKATALEQVVYLTAEHAARHARDDQELWWMLAQCQEHVVAFAGDGRFPQAYAMSYASAGLKYQQLKDALAPYAPGREQGEGDKTKNRGKQAKYTTKRKRDADSGT
jgi:hypothetical protein